MGHGKAKGEKHMNERSFKAEKLNAPATALTAMMLAGGAVGAPVPAATTAKATQAQTAKKSTFHCNIKALSPDERRHHQELTEVLMASRTQIVETETGYEFQYRPGAVSLAQLADWVVAEGKCCPFFDFRIDLERAGSLLCLRLTGEDGSKPFIRSEFQVSEKR
jgi:hypothetical protein